MKKKISFLLVMILIMSFIFAACGSDLPFRDDDGPAIVNRYEANSYTGEDKIKYMYTYGDEDEEGHYKEYDFYYIYLGELTNIPLFYKASSYHSGSNFKYTFSTTNVTETKIAETVADSTQSTNSVIKEHSYTSGNSQMLGAEISTKYNLGVFNGEIKVKGELSWDQHTTDTNTTGFEETTSLTNTHEYATTTAYSTMESREWTLTKDDKAGYYRCTMFSPSDIYLYVIKDSDTNELYYEFKEYIIPNSYFWALDYSETASFRKNDDTKFELDLSILDNLPKPILSFSEKPNIPAIITQPSNCVTKTGGSATFKVEAYGFPSLNYQWQVSTNGGIDWSDITNTGVYSGATTAVLALTNIAGAYFGYQYRCIASNFLGTVTSEIAMLMIETTPMIMAGDRNTVALKSDGTVWAWGRNEYGQLGDSTTTNRLTPVQVKGANGAGNLTGITAIAANRYHTVALKSDGTVWAWGRNEYGQLGDGTKTNRSTPVQVKGAGGSGYLTDIIAIAADYSHTVALKSDGTVWTWGENNYGQLGDGTITNRLIPVQVKSPSGVGNLVNIIAVATGDYHTVALKSDGTVWTWGWNSYGRLGDGTTTNRSTPVQVKGAGGSGYLTDIIAIAAGLHTVALKSDGTVWAWGLNSSGRLGDGTTTTRLTPVQVKGLNGAGNLTGIAAITIGGAYTVALKMDGTVWAWGNNYSGQLGDGTTTDRLTPVQVKGLNGTGNLTGIIAIAAGFDHTVALKSDGTVWAWGYNYDGCLGDGTTTKRLAPVQVKGFDGIGYLKLK